MDLLTYLAERGSQTRLAEAIEAQPQLVWQWAQPDGRRRVPVERCPAIERATAGAVTCEELRPDACWHRVADPAWPWHPQGRPLIDVARRATLALQDAQHAA
jgi:DNA-binding transcriptional regulator YdaS (Cro superfamily)